MAGNFGTTTVTIDDVRSGHARDLLAETDVVIAVDVSTREEEVVYGRHEWELACDTGHEEDLIVLRVELDMETGDLEWLVDAMEETESGDNGDRTDDIEDREEED
jgi:hypothetical protein